MCLGFCSKKASILMYPEVKIAKPPAKARRKRNLFSFNLSVNGEKYNFPDKNNHETARLIETVYPQQPRQPFPPLAQNSKVLSRVQPTAGQRPLFPIAIGMAASTWISD
ncbi:hypothetical protein SprV_0301136900 [Sparganum proliferum]